MDFFYQLARHETLQMQAYELRQKLERERKELARKDALAWVQLKVQEEKLLKGEFKHE